MTSVGLSIPPRRSMTLYALLAIAMGILSYIVVMLLAAACVYLPWELAVTTDAFGMQTMLLLLFGLVLAGGLLWSLVPRRDKFVAPGVLLERSQHAELFAEIDGIAGALNQPVPKEVYLIAQVNAWVADRGGVMGFGSRRVMALGLPLMSVMTVSQFRGVLAHEFAHYYGGDTSLGPWV